MLRKIPKESLGELKAIFDVTGATERIETVNRCSEQKAKEMGLTMEEYFDKTFNECSDCHFND